MHCTTIQLEGQARQSDSLTLRRRSRSTFVAQLSGGAQPPCCFVACSKRAAARARLLRSRPRCCANRTSESPRCRCGPPCICCGGSPGRAQLAARAPLAHLIRRSSRRLCQPAACQGFRACWKSSLPPTQRTSAVPLYPASVNKVPGRGATSARSMSRTPCRNGCAAEPPPPGYVRGVAARLLQ
jgi:hypothetical protein